MKRLWKIAAVAAWTVCGAYGSTATQAQALYSAHQFEQAYTAYVSLVAAEPANAELNFTSAEVLLKPSGTMKLWRLLSGC